MTTTAVSAKRTPEGDIYVKVACVTCGKHLGYVVAHGHKDWQCEDCSQTRAVHAVNLDRPVPLT